MADLDKLNSQLNNLKDLDAAQLAGLLKEHKNPLIMSVLVIGSLLIAFVMFNNYRAKDHDLNTQISQGRDKTDALKARDTANQDLINFKSTIPKKFNMSQLITLISQYAKLYNVTIGSLSPAESKNMGLYDALNVSVNGEANNFKNLILFLRKVEESNNSLTINSWIGQVGDKGVIKFQIEVSAVLIHI